MKIEINNWLQDAIVHEIEKEVLKQAAVHFRYGDFGVWVERRHFGKYELQFIVSSTHKRGETKTYSFTPQEALRLFLELDA